MSTAAPRIPTYTSLVLSGVRGAADQEQHGVTGDMIDRSKTGPDGAGNTEPTPNPLVPGHWKEGLSLSIREVPGVGAPTAPVIPINAPTRAVLWSRHQLALSVLQHGRVDAQEVIAILSGASIEELRAPKAGA